ncbi:PAS domain-containing protein [Hyalangium rubrum]|uniref:histidine kinase n=1 Tax=Hyalangium rubrum TaxID=3103134 RepID=A0ABU5H2D1_9BACT|nr:PAS domain-containing protein [Hyalangium sp. s54d21]MDY7226255.1 PAS domain-containing protein [Hyalangium sp. s54d21]
MPSVADFIEEHRAHLVQRYAEEVAKLDSARGLSVYELTNTFPEYLDTLSASSRRGDRGDTARTKRRLEETHLSLRLRLGYKQEEVTTEYAIMGRLIAGLWSGLSREQQPSPEDTALLFAELQEAMDFAIALFSGYTLEDRQREKRTLRRLDALSPKALEPSREPAALRRQLTPLVEVIQEAIGASGAELYLADASGERLFAITATGSCESHPFSAPVALSPASFLGQVAESEEPLHLPDAASALKETTEGLCSSRLRSLLGLRLWPHGKLLGVLYVGLAEVRSFEPQARRYFETLVEYLSGIIDRTLLFGQLHDANTQLRESEDRLRLAVIAGQLGTWDFRPVTGVLHWDERCKALFGLPPEAEVTYETFLAGLHPEDRSRVDAAVQQALEPHGRGEFDIEYRVVGLRDGQERWARSIGRTHFEEGRAVRFIGTVQDISALKQAQESLELSERQFRTLADSIPQIVWAARPNGQVDYANQRFAEYVGKSVEALLRDGWEKLLHPDNLPLVLEAWRRSIATGEPYQVEQHLRHAEGTYRWHLTRAVPVRDEQGRIIRWVGTSTDIDELKRSEAELRRTASFEQQLIGIVSHDLRNPLNAITLSAHALLRGEELTARQAKSVARLVSSAERATRMTRDLLDFTQARLGGGIPIERKPLDFQAAVRQVLEEVQAAHPERLIAFDGRGDPRGSWDADRLAQVVTNLVNNALAYSPPETPVRVETRGEEREVLLCVHNQGPPIPSDMLPLLFEPMRRGTEQGSAGRSIGLGLFIVDSIVRAHGGRIEVRSDEATGTTFTVHLPRGAPGG